MRFAMVEKKFVNIRRFYLLKIFVTSYNISLDENIGNVVIW
jgi:hypothetical protein